MICKGSFIFRGLEKREAGTFKDDNGNEIKYSSSYLVKVDEIVEGKALERRFKFDLTNSKLASDFSNLQIYTPVEISFDVNIYPKSVTLVPKQLFVVEKK